MGFDRQSRRRISRSVLFTERLNRSRTPHVGGNRNPSKNPFYWGVALEDILRGGSGAVQLLGSNGSPIAGETRTVHNDYETAVWQNAQCVITVVDGEFRIVAADTATLLLCSTDSSVSSLDASFSATVIKDLDGHYGKASITAENTFSQDYDASELFFAIRNEQEDAWQADKVGDGGSGGNEVLVRFELTGTLTLAGTSAAAETLTQAGVKTGVAITVHDRVGEWAGLATYQGIAFRGDNAANNFDIVFLEAKARWIRGTLSDPIVDAVGTASVTAYWGAAPNGRDPGASTLVYDLLGGFYWARAGDGVFAVWDEKEGKYIVVWVEFPADVFAVTLTQDGGMAGVNGASNCTFTYTVENRDTGDLLGNTISPVHPRPSLTQMLPATSGLAHWENIGGASVLVLDHAFEVPTPRATYSPVTDVACSPTAGIEIYRRDVFLPVGSRIDSEYLSTTIVCPGFGATPGCGLVESSPGVWDFEPSPDVVGVAATTCLEADGTCGIKIDLTEDTTIQIHSAEGISLSHDGMGTMTATLHYRTYTFSRNACGLTVNISDAGTATYDGDLMTEPCPPPSP